MTNRMLVLATLRAVSLIIAVNLLFACNNHKKGRYFLTDSEVTKHTEKALAGDTHSGMMLFKFYLAYPHSVRELEEARRWHEFGVAHQCGWANAAWTDYFAEILDSTPDADEGGPSQPRKSKIESVKNK